MEMSRNPFFATPAQRWQARRAIAVLALTSAAVCSNLWPAHAQSPMISGWLAANTVCKSGPGGDPKTQKACEKRDEIGARLERRGCVHQEDGDWWKCQPKH